jgi:chromosomal replication initiator protein
VLCCPLKNRSLKLSHLKNGVARFEVPTTFFGDWVQRNYADHIRMHLASTGATVDRLEFSVGAVESRAADPKPAAKPVRARPANDADLPGAPLDARFTFDSFRGRQAERTGTCRRPPGRRRRPGQLQPAVPLWLAWALARPTSCTPLRMNCSIRRPELRVLYLSAEQFMYRFVQALRERQIMDFKELFRSVDVLMVDDVQFIAGKDSTQEEFFHTFNALVDQNKQIVISADRAPGEIKDLEDRIKSRLQCGLVVDLHPTDYELRLGILQQKVDFYRGQYRGLKLADGVLEFLAHRITTNVRVLEGALTRLFAFASLVGREITLELAQDCLADILQGFRPQDHDRGNPAQGQPSITTSACPT